MESVPGITNGTQIRLNIDVKSAVRLLDRESMRLYGKTSRTGTP